MGYYEKDDLKTVIEYLRNSGRVSRIGLWGRSMGAATSLMYAPDDPSIAGMVLDSPFTSLVQVHLLFLLFLCYLIECIIGIKRIGGEYTG